MEFEWNPAKSAVTFHQRGFDFGYASRIFAGPCLRSEDTRTDYGEIRMKAIGRVETDILAVIYTMRGSALRIISARRANRKERTEWQSRA